MIDVTDEQLAMIQAILKRQVPDAEVRLFGSRADGSARRHSDLDLIVVGNAKCDRGTMNRLCEAFEDSDLPFRVEILDWHRLSESFRDTIGGNYTVLQRPQNEETRD